ncbi:MAG: hydrolase [Salinisphaeraceae bacterium]|jgi:predicted alpha/beta-fold hydrolase|nr:hydrolase [Salinisphaeraceae bacterium]
MIVRSPFRPAPWLRNAHLQTVFASEARRMPALDLDLEILELPDGDFLELAWGPPADGPLIILLHGVIGSTESKYARGMMQAMTRRGWQSLLMLFRGAGGRPNRLPRGYHSGETDDFRHVLGELRRRFPERSLNAAGYSMGGNVLLKYLGESGHDTPLDAAAAVSVPFDLDLCATAIGQGLSRHYQRYIIEAMRAAAREKFSRQSPPFPLPPLEQLQDFYAFDDALTAPLHGFRDARDYYRQASCGPFLADIRRPTLVVHAEDDPFMTPAVVPREADLAPEVRLELSRHGGHVGFVAADRFGRPRYWLEERLPAFFEATARTLRDSP